MSRDLSKFQKETKEEEKRARSVLITVKQIDFLEKHNLNLSKLVRDFLEKLMEDQTKAP